jgi:hypothetical protein
MKPWRTSKYFLGVCLGAWVDSKGLVCHNGVTCFAFGKALQRPVMAGRYDRIDVDMDIGMERDDICMYLGPLCLATPAYHVWDRSR